ncbi:hypothetical protein ACF8D3_16025 [Acinetobacter sp. YQ_14]|uniref:hypothetical protein n=1 Tax=Acinetobacter sp. YQ_14 TaxID=3367236 RepID=UPI00370ABBBC
MNSIILSLIFYTLGIGGLFFVDILINHYFSANDIKLWVLNKSLMMMIGPLLLLGYNNVFLRYPEKIKSTLDLCLHLSIFWLIFGFILDYFFKFEFSYFIVVSFSFSLFVTSLLRVANGNLAAQINQSIWKILLLFFVLFTCYYSNLNKYYYVMLGLFLFLPSLLYLLKCSSQLKSDNSIKLEKDNHSFARQMLISGLLLNVATYYELFLLAKFYDAKLVSKYFLYFTLFTAYGIFLSGYLGFYLTPKIRKQPEKTLHFIEKNKYKIRISIVAVGLLNFIFGCAYLLCTGVQLDLFLAIMFLLLGMLRVLYIFPTSKMGALANPVDLKSFLGRNIILTILYMLVLILVVYFDFSLYIVILVVILNWLFRVFIANKIARRIEEN